MNLARFGLLDAHWDARRRRYVLDAPLSYRYLADDHEEEIIVPRGFATDLDSVPRIPWAYAWLKGRALQSAVVHDWLYFSQAGKAYADRVFLQAMKDEGVPLRHRWPIYLGVVLGGHSSYASPAGMML